MLKRKTLQNATSQHFSTLNTAMVSDIKGTEQKKEAKQNLLAMKRSPREAVNMDQKHRQMYGPGICTAAKQKLDITCFAQNAIQSVTCQNIAKVLRGDSCCSAALRTLWKIKLGNDMSVPAMEKHLFNLKFAVKDLERSSKKCEKEEKLEQAKVKKAIQKGNMDVARIHAENAIRQKSQALNYLRMAARVDAVASRVQSALTTRKVTNSMAGVVKAMDAAMKDLDVQSSYMENTMSQTTTTAVPQADVDNLLQQVADEAGLELNMELPSGPQTSTIGASTQVSQEQDELTQRLARLRQAE
ncbi:unnamed protein product [Hermetia illucens]|uniref:Charged multivesicular body protein 1b n=1 Tax=Hermetia illucens TaxID=343691 RepID=A0A7R8UI68_HERIL|nr:unnamed protein product [Hermetia illucens]